MAATRRTRSRRTSSISKCSTASTPTATASLDTWLPAADAGSAGDWSPAAVLAAPATTLARIKALRVGIIVRGEQFDRAATRPFEWVLFDCAATDKTHVPGAA